MDLIRGTERQGMRFRDRNRRGAAAATERVRGWGNPKTGSGRFPRARGTCPKTGESDAGRSVETAAAQDHAGREMAFANANVSDDSGAPGRSRREAQNKG